MMKNRKQSASLTVEGSFIFPWIMLLVIAFLKLDFTLHDRALATACTTLAGLRYEQYRDFSYDSTQTSIDTEKLIRTPVLSTEAEALAKEEQAIREREEQYFDGHKLSGGSSCDATAVEDVLKVNKNAQIIRAGTKLVQIIGKDES